MVKVFAWYDNEWGYSHRLVDMAVVAVKGKSKIANENSEAFRKTFEKSKDKNLELEF